MDYVDVEGWAKAYDKNLTATDPRFSHSVSLAEDEGCFFFWKHAFYIKLADPAFMESLVDDQYKEPKCGEVYYCVFTEHHGFHIFDVSDVLSIRENSEQVTHKFQSIKG